MSGGAWGYQSYKIEANIERLSKMLQSVAETEHIVDWAISGDTLRSDAEKELFDLWVSTFNNIYGER